MLMLQIILLSIAIMAIVMAMLATQILLKKGGKFPNTHIGGNKEMAKRGIFCATTQDKMEQKSGLKIKHLNIDSFEDSQIRSC